MTWVFGYGSLIWKPAFDYAERAPVVLCGWKRRFWQLSPDHRGTPTQPGRVATLVADEGAQTVGVAYRLATAQREEILTALDYRERAGYVRREVQVSPLDGGPRFMSVAYVANEANDNFAGSAPVAAIAAHIARCAGPSGCNDDYVVKLQQSLAELGCADPHIDAIVANLVELDRHSG